MMIGGHETADLTDADKLRALAEWFDLYDEWNFSDGDEVQRDLRRIARQLDSQKDDS